MRGIDIVASGAPTAGGPIVTVCAGARAMPRLAIRAARVATGTRPNVRAARGGGHPPFELGGSLLAGRRVRPSRPSGVAPGRLPTVRVMNTFGRKTFLIALLAA